jgi:hypothetical protein
MTLRPSASLQFASGRLATTGVLAAALLASIAIFGCGAPEPPKPPLAEVTGSTKPPVELRGLRYCEVLIAASKGLRVTIDVYNSIGLNECPEADWSKLDAAQLTKELHAERVLLNGPRYWTFDRMEGSHLIDPTPRSFHGLAMRLAGRLELSVSEATGKHEPYTRHDVRRTTTWFYEAGKPVYELVDGDGHVYAMQSYSVQHAPQTAESLATLGERLKPPPGWSFRTRVLDAELRVTAVDGVAHVVQDDFANTYQQSR